MAKISKSQLKAVVKECLVEILAEGLNENSIALNNKKQAKKRHRAEERRLVEHRKKFETTVDTTVAHVTDDPIMQSILQDTARTTLQEQIANEASPSAAGHSMAAPAVGGSAAGIDLDNIFSGTSDNWSKLAFTE